MIQKLISSNTAFSAYSEEQLVMLVKQGNTHAANDLITRLYSLVYFASEKFTGIGLEREDLVQEGMIAVLNAMRTFKADAGVAFKTYANRCVYNHFNSIARSMLQKKHIPKEKLVSDNHFIQDETQNPELMVIEKERVEEITKALKAKLSEFEFEILNQYLSGYSAAEIAERFGIDVKRVTNALYRIRQKFHFILK